MYVEQGSERTEQEEEEEDEEEEEEEEEDKTFNHPFPFHSFLSSCLG